MLRNWGVTLVIPLCFVGSACRQEPVSEREPEMARLEIVTPLVEDVLYTNGLARVFMTYPASDLDEPRLRLSGLDTDTELLLTALGPDAAEHMLDVGKLSLGTYRLIASASAATDEVVTEFRVSDPPAITVRASELLSTDQGLVTEFAAAVELPDGVRATSFVWTPGDEAEAVVTQTPTLTATFNGPERVEHLYLTVLDSVGGSSSTFVTFNIPEPGLTPPLGSFLLAPPMPATLRLQLDDDTLDCRTKHFGVLHKERPEPSQGLFRGACGAGATCGPMPREYVTFQVRPERRR